jgi:hypothetical protein
MHVEQTIAALRFEPTLPLWLIGVLAAVCLVALAPALWRRARGAIWRLAAFAVLLLWLAGPRLVQETAQSLPDVGVLAVDQTASMGVNHRADLAETARRSLERQVGGLPDLELRTVTVPEAGSSGTQLFAALRRALADIPRSRLAGVIAITDGQIHDVPDEAAGATLLGGAPLHLLLPAKGEETDRSLRIVEAPSYGIVGKPATIKLSVDDLGPAAHATAARLTTRRDGEPPVEEMVPVGREYAVQVPITRGGPTVVELAVEPLLGEVSLLNNRAVVTINGVRDRLRVLLVSGEPHAGERTWRRLLKSDPAVDLVHFTILRPPEKDDLTPLNELALIAFPVRELFLVKLHEFDLIILDRFQNRGLLPMPYLRNISDYVNEGGALLMSVGPEFANSTSLAYSALSSAIPARPAKGPGGVIEQAFRPQVTPLGERHPVTEDLAGGSPTAQPSWGQWYRWIDVESTEGQTLMSGPGSAPLLVLDRIGEGRAALLLSDQIWLWSRGHDGGGPQAELLRRVAHWLMKEPELEENVLAARVDNGQLFVEQRSTDETPPGEVTVTDPDGHTTRLALNRAGPGRASATMAATTPGVWQASDGARTAFAAAGSSNPLEIADLRATATKTAALVHASDGSVHWLDNGTADGDVPALRRTEPGREGGGAGWLGLARRHDRLVTGVAALPLLPVWLALPLLLGLVLIAWRRESV